MKIQEMRSGILHKARRPEPVKRNNVFEMRSISEPIFDDVLPAAIESDLEKSMWSVVSFDQRQAGGLTYNKAAELLSELDAYDIPGLCIITDDAAARLTS
ncbi:MAG: hypothetical protein QM785_01160 [Pyrinomonadaceae bacterium]